MSGATGPWSVLVGPRLVARRTPTRVRGEVSTPAPRRHRATLTEATCSVSGARDLLTAGRPARPDGFCPYDPLTPQCAGLSRGDRQPALGTPPRTVCGDTGPPLSLDCSHRVLSEVLRSHHFNDSDEGYDHISIKKSLSDRCPRVVVGSSPKPQGFWPNLIRYRRARI